MTKREYDQTSGFLARRDFIRSGAVFLTAATAAAVAPSASRARELPENMLTPGPADEPYGNPSPFEKDVVRTVWPQDDKNVFTRAYDNGDARFSGNL